jgi:hypothetical protein
VPGILSVRISPQAKLKCSGPGNSNHIHILAGLGEEKPSSGMKQNVDNAKVTGHQLQLSWPINSTPFTELTRMANVVCSNFSERNDTPRAGSQNEDVSGCVHWNINIGVSKYVCLLPSTAFDSSNCRAYTFASYDHSRSYQRTWRWVQNNTCFAHKPKKKKTKLHGLGPRANYTDRATRRLSAKLVPAFADRGCHMVSAKAPCRINLCRTRSGAIFRTCSHQVILDFQWFRNH